MATLSAIEERTPQAFSPARLLLQPVSLSILVAIATQALGMVTGVLLARELGPHDRGVLAAVILWPGILTSIGSLGIHEAETFTAARRVFPTGTLVTTAGTICAIQSLVLCAIGLVVIPLVFKSRDAAIERTALLYLAYIPLQQTLNLFLSTLNGLHKFRAFLGLRLSLFVSQAAGIGLLALTGHLTIGHVAMVYLATFGLIALAGALVLGMSETLTPRLSLPLAKSLLSFGIRSHSANVSGQLNERLDQLLISLFLAPVSLGLYVTAVTMTSLVGLIGYGVSVIALPTISKLGPGPEQTRAIKGFLRLTLIASVLVTLPLVVLAPRLIELFFGRQFSGAAAIARVLLPAAVLLATARAAGSALKGMGRPLDAGWSEFIALGVTIAGLSILLPAFGLMGAAVASLLAYGTSAAWSFSRIGSRLDISPWRLLAADETSRSDRRRLATRSRA